MTNRFFDIHHHILCGLDDGAKDERMMQAMLRRAWEDGTAQIAATVHVEPGVRRFDREAYLKTLDAARHFCQQEGMDIRLHEGAEILYTAQACRMLQDGEIPTLADTDRVLVEFSPDVAFKTLKQALESLVCGGFVPVIAHVERYQCLTHRPSRALALKDELPILYQVNCGALLRQGGWFHRHFIDRMFEMEYIDAVATDAHNLTSRSSRMSEAYALIASRWGKAYAQTLTCGDALGSTAMGWKTHTVF